MGKEYTTLAVEKELSNRLIDNVVDCYSGEMCYYRGESYGVSDMEGV